MTLKPPAHSNVIRNFNSGTAVSRAGVACSLLIGLLAAGCLTDEGAGNREPGRPLEGYYSERHRPQFHFTPERNWMNDPNGMVYYDGEYHLFYQYNPFGDTWGHMSWGHAVSPDLVHWEHLPVALAEEDGIMIFSGSAVVDWNNTSGFGTDGKPPLVAIYTGHYTGDRSLQNQQIAYSNDRGRTWTKYAGNPVLDIGETDFRDPKVFWHDETGQWIMVVSLPVERKVQFYGSPNLKEWTHLSDFGPAGAVQGIWECPDLFPLPVEGTDEERWVLIVNIGGHSVAGGSGCQYFVGEFDGTHFKPVQELEEERMEDPSASVIRVLADFDSGDYQGWESEGDAFGSAPASGTLANQQPVTGFQGSGLVNSYRNGDGSTGTLISPGFELEGDYLNFLIGGGRHPGQTGMRLLIDGNTVRTATGRDEERLDWHSWEVRQWQGRTARLEIFDRHTEGWGHINVDQIVLSDRRAEPSKEEAFWVDYGRDFYAAVSWSDVPEEDGRRLWLGWMSNWEYANEVPTSPWRSAMSIPRALSLRQVGSDYRLIQTPVRELHDLRQRKRRIRFVDKTGVADLGREIPSLGRTYELQARIQPLSDANFALDFRSGVNERTRLRFDIEDSILTLDRTESGVVEFNEQFPDVFSAPVRLVNGALTLRVFVDTSSIEVFINGGETVITSLILPKPESTGLNLIVDGGELELFEMDFWNLSPVW